MAGFNILSQKDSVEFGKLMLFSLARENNFTGICIDPSLFCIGAW